MHERCFQSKYSNNYSRQIPPRVCTLVLFIKIVEIVIIIIIIIIIIIVTTIIIVNNDINFLN